MNPGTLSPDVESPCGGLVALELSLNLMPINNVAIEDLLEHLILSVSDNPVSLE